MTALGQALGWVFLRPRSGRAHVFRDGIPNLWCGEALG